MSKEAMKLALEALEVATTPLAKDRQEVLRAQAALREALANEALDRMAENARELGLDYEPAQQEPVDFASLLREAEELVREKPTWKRFIEGTPLSNDIAVWMTVFAQDVARRTSPPAQQEPVAWKLVPREPTHEMLKAMDECSTEGYDERLYAGHASSVYMAAFDAAPTPQAQRTWVDLTDEELKEFDVDPIEAKLMIAKHKEKNT